MTLGSSLDYTFFIAKTLDPDETTPDPTVARIKFASPAARDHMSLPGSSRLTRTILSVQKLF